MQTIQKLSLLQSDKDLCRFYNHWYYRKLRKQCAKGFDFVDMPLINGRLSKLLAIQSGAFIVARWRSKPHVTHIVKPKYHWYEALMMSALHHGNTGMCECYRIDSIDQLYTFIGPIARNRYVNSGGVMGEQLSFLDVYIIFKKEKQKEKKNWIRKLIRL